MKKQSLSAVMAAKGMKLRTWCKAMCLSDADYLIIKDISKGRIKGIRGKSKKLRKLLEQSGFKVA